MMPVKMIVIGGSLGGYKALKTVLSTIGADFSIPIAVVLHVGADSIGGLADLLSRDLRLTVQEAEDKLPIRPSTIYLAPAGYHLLIEDSETFALSVDEKENYSRPSIDALFESAADVYGANLLGVILTGANADGARGLAKIQRSGGFTIVQEPSSAEAGEMLRAAISELKPDLILTLPEIAGFFATMGSK
jgi:two-component system chemotaxis response regulator CheB